MFAGRVDLENGKSLKVVIAPLKGSRMPGHWDTKTDLVLICLMDNGRFCTSHVGETPTAFVRELELSHEDAESLGRWIKTNL